MGFLRDLKIGQKLALIVGVMGIPIALLAYFLIAEQGTQISSTVRQTHGVAYLRPLRKILESLPAHRAAAAAALRGRAASKEQLPGLTAAIDADIAAANAMQAELSATLGAVADWAQFKLEWAAVKKDGGITAEQSFQQHSALINRLTALIRDVGDRSELSVAPEIESRFLVDASIKYLPQLIETVGLAEAIATAAAEPGGLENAADLASSASLGSGMDVGQALNRLLGQIDLQIHDLERGAKVAYSRDPALERRIGPALEKARLASRSFVDMTFEGVVRASQRGSGGRQADAANYREAAALATGAALELYDDALTNLDAALEDRIDRLEKDTLVQLAIAVFVLTLTTLLAYFLQRTVTEQIVEINRLFDRISVGDLAARAEARSGDELGRLTVSLNRMLDNTLTLVQSSEERDRIQRSIEKLLDEVAGVAEGDLTKEAEVTAEVTGAIADSFNYMIAELRNIIAQVQQTTLQVSAAANQIQRTAEELATGSEKQSSQIVETTSAVDEMAQSIQHVSSNAVSAARVAKEALENARRGAGAVVKTIEGMHAIRGRVQETARRIKRLGESSQEIGEIVSLIGDIADRTSILALNASIQASAAGEEGRGFAVVAEEVESLAERAAESAKRIAGLIKMIQQDMNEAVGAMEETTREVVGGSNVANEAGQKLDQIETVSTELASLIQSISESSRMQARGSESVAHAMSDISSVTRRTAEGARQAAESIRNLARLADELRHSVSRFKVPAQAKVA
jgi:twitching motility protein PilJ